MSLLLEMSRVAQVLSERQGPVRLLGAAQGGSAVAISELASHLGRLRVPLCVVTPSESMALAMAPALRFFVGQADAAHPALNQLAPIETSPYSEITPDRRAIMKRLATCLRLCQGTGAQILLASVPALMRRIMPREGFSLLSQTIAKGETLDREKTIESLIAAGYDRLPMVEDPGTFAVRGGVIDVFCPYYAHPARVELFGDEVESIRFFHPQTQRTDREVTKLHLHPVRETVSTPKARLRAMILDAADRSAHPSTKTRTIMEQLEKGYDFFGVEAFTPAFHSELVAINQYLPSNVAYFLVDPPAIRAAAEELFTDASTRYAARIAEHRLALAPEEHYLTPAELEGLWLDRPRVEAPTLELLGDDGGQTFRIATADNLALAQEMSQARSKHHDGMLKPLVRALSDAREQGLRVGVVCTNRSHAQRLTSVLAGYRVETREVSSEEPPLAALAARDYAAPCAIFIGQLAAGVKLPEDRLWFIAEDEIFGPRSHRRKSDAKPSATRQLADALASFAELAPGDLLVHTKNGVGRYHGVKKLPIRGTDGAHIDFLHIEYEGGTLYLPVYRLSEVSRYVGAEGQNPKLDRLGGVTWEKTRSRVSAEVRKLAEELLQLYAEREAQPGHAYPPSDQMVHEFEATFDFEETPDQQQAIDDVMRDMDRARPMDRLVCGDVGYGKTEVAMRAAFRAVAGKKQVALLAPTTVLVEQHYQTLLARMKNWPIEVAALSRFLPKGELSEVLKRLAEGKIDIIVGTHRLLSNDVRWKDLGLVIIDEEQRFGVAHKERLKKIRTEVDVLTLTATPIPRTLHMGMIGVRDLSIIATPPADRLAIRTYVCRPDDAILEEAIRRELARGGQAFFVCHRIGDGKGKNTDRSLAEWAEHLRSLVPEARVASAHGQMSADALERVMVDFVDHRYDVLVSTTIIESGLDIPRANTMFVNRADAFGLAQLYQLRGRIGRSKERAFCYLMIPPESTLSDDAKKRLEALQRFTELGAGFQIASHDLGIRGAGDFLGARQSGQIAQVGFDTYVQILQEAVAELRGGAIKPARDPELNTDLPAFIPDDYVPDTGQRLDLYKRLSSAEDADTIQGIVDEMGDRFGDVPEEVLLLSQLMARKAQARPLGVVALEVNVARIVLTLDAEATPLDPAKVLGLVKRPTLPFRLTPDMRLVRNFDENERKTPLESARIALLEVSECVK